jgi:thymidylate synthase
MSFEHSYRNLLRYVKSGGRERTARNGLTRQQFGTTLEITELISQKFPIITGREIFYKPVLGELAAFLKGATELETFKQYGCNYWNANAAAWTYNEGTFPEHFAVGNIYGAKWRNFHGVDQLKQLVKSIKTDPNSRRHLLTAFDPSEKWQCLPPCHLFAQFDCIAEQLDCIVYMRSVDLVHGLPSDIVLYAALLLLLCQATNRDPGKLTFFMGDTHIYDNHKELIGKYLDHAPCESPTYELDPWSTLENFAPNDLRLINYQHGERIVFPFNV